MKKKKIEIIFKAIPIFFIILHIICFSLYFITNNLGNVRRAIVTEVKDKTLKLEIGEQLGDPLIYEIPKYPGYKKNDIIYVKINSKKVHKTINPEFIPFIPFLFYFLVPIVLIIWIIKEILKSNN